eukprot:scaffold31068_cov37-Prasinocladus_malaysianus.AAC.1
MHVALSRCACATGRLRYSPFKETTRNLNHISKCLRWTRELGSTGEVAVASSAPTAADLCADTFCITRFHIRKGSLACLVPAYCNDTV